MKKYLLIGFIGMLAGFNSNAQEDRMEEKKGFKKENLFTGGSVSLSFFNNSFLIGANPVLGYSITRWADAGIAINYNYTSFRDYQQFNDRLRQTVYGGGVFARIFPVRFLFAQVQAEHNLIKLKYLPPNNGNPIKDNTDANSLLVGGGYTTNRYPGSGQSFFYVSVLFDVSDNPNSPYTDAAGRAVPIFRAGVNIPLFQGSNRLDY